MSNFLEILQGFKENSFQYKSKHSVMPLLVKNGTAWNKPKEARKGWNVPKTTPNKWNKEKPPSCELVCGLRLLIGNFVKNISSQIFEEIVNPPT